MTRDRKQRRLLEKEAQARFRKKGLSLNILDVKLVVFARHLAKILDQISNPHRAQEAAAYGQGILEKSLQHNLPGDTIACQKGCHFCCQNFVSATAPQVFLLAHHIKALPDYEAMLNALQKADDLTRDRPKSQRAQERLPCALLVDGVCSQYEHRPTACRGMASLNVRSCEVRVDGIQAAPGYALLRGLVDFGFMAGIEINGLGSKSYELNHALRVALQTPDGEQRWLGGEDIFKDVQVDHWEDGAGASSEDFLKALIKASQGRATDILDVDLV